MAAQFRGYGSAGEQPERDTVERDGKRLAGRAMTSNWSPGLFPFQPSRPDCLPALSEAEKLIPSPACWPLNVSPCAIFTGVWITASMAAQIELTMNENPTPPASPETPAQPAPDSPEFDTFTPETTSEHDQAPPPAASLVVNGTIRNERELQLERELQREREERRKADEARRKAETDAAYAQDEARRLKEIQITAAQPKPKVKRVAVGFWETED